MIVTGDTNLFVYAVDARDPSKRDAAVEVVRGLRDRRSPLGLQVVGEFYRAATRRLNLTPWEAAQEARNLLASFPSFSATRSSTTRALAAAAARQFSFWDANLLSAAEEAGCTHLISEDMQDGARLGRIEVVRAFDEGAVSARARDILIG